MPHAFAQLPFGGRSEPDPAGAVLSWQLAALGMLLSCGLLWTAVIRFLLALV